MTITTIGLDTSKTWFQVHCVDADGRTVLRRKLARSKVLSFFANIPSCLVGLEACGGSHFWTRELAKLGHDARLMPARYVRAYVKTNKHDAADAEACCEAAPGTRSSRRSTSVLTSSVIWSAAPFAPALSKGADGWRGGFLAALYVGDADRRFAFVGQIVASTELFCLPPVDVEGTSPPPAAVCARGGVQAFEQPNP
jgi:hypothetical protein